MDVLVSGSLAYDRIMDFPGRYDDHFMPDQLHNINLSLMVNGLVENFGGTAGNIAYALSLLAEKPRILAAIGQDSQKYLEWLERFGLETGDIRVIPEEFTASAYITTDLNGNQITFFNPGAMKHPSELNTDGIDPENTIAIVAPGNLDDMARYPKVYRGLGVFCIFDPGQSLPAWEGPALIDAIALSDILISNEFELEMITNKTGLSIDGLLDRVGTVITTKGAAGTEVLTHNEVTSVPAVETTNVVDPTGAGDAFRGGLIKGLVMGIQIERAAQMGSVCAHYAIQRQGTQEYSFTLEEYTSKMEQVYGPPPRFVH